MNISGRVIEYKHCFRLLFCKFLQMQTKFVRKSTLIYGDSPAARHTTIFSLSLSLSLPISSSQCGYVAEHASDMCQKEGHALSRFKAVKRCFECQECRERAHTYNAKYPPFSCRQAGLFTCLPIVVCFHVLYMYSNVCLFSCVYMHIE